MIVWLNGPFGGGKTSTADALVAARPEWRVFDPEIVGHFLRAAMPDLTDVDDFQDLAAWRPLVAASLHEVATQTGQHLIAPQSVLSEEYFTQIVEGLALAGRQVFHVVLDAPQEVLRRRIEAVDEARAWRLDHLPVYLDAREWMLRRADLVVDTSAQQPPAVAATILDATATLTHAPDRPAPTVV